MKQEYANQLATIKETFPDWTDLDLLLALQESDGDLNVASEKILEGGCFLALAVSLARLLTLDYLQAKYPSSLKFLRRTTGPAPRSRRMPHPTLIRRR